MQLNEIQDYWESDSKIDRTELGEESLKIPQLHSKYFKIYSNERIRLKELENQYKSFHRIKYEYYMGQLSEEDHKRYGWEPNQLKILKTDVSMYIDGDEEVIAIKRKIQLQEEKLDFLESIIKTLNNRGFLVKNAIDWIKFTQGA